MKKHRKRRANKAHKAEKKKNRESRKKLLALEYAILRAFLRRLEAQNFPCGGHVSDVEYILSIYRQPPYALSTLV